MAKKIKATKLAKQGLSIGQTAVFGTAGAAHSLTGLVESITTFMAGMGAWLFPALTMFFSISKTLGSVLSLLVGNKNIGKWQDFLFNTFQLLLGCGFLVAGLVSTPVVAGLILLSIFATNTLYSFASFCFNFLKSRNKNLQPEARKQYKENALAAFIQFFITGSILAIAGAIVACMVFAPAAIMPLVFGMGAVASVGAAIGGTIFLKNLRNYFFGSKDSVDEAQQKPANSVEKSLILGENSDLSQDSDNSLDDNLSNSSDESLDTTQNQQVESNFGEGYYGTLKTPVTSQDQLQNLINSKIDTLFTQIENGTGFFASKQKEKRLAKINRLNLCAIALGVYGAERNAGKKVTQKDITTLKANKTKILDDMNIYSLYSDKDRLDQLINFDKHRSTFENSAHQSLKRKVGEVEQIEQEVRTFLAHK